MIKFFRRIRQRLLSENKFSKYLIYAIGEIVLVVIGILIALTLNNNNEKQKSEAKVLIVFDELLEELASDIKSIKEAGLFYQQKDSLSFLVLHTELTKEDYQNDISSYHMLTGQTTGIELSNNSYNKLLEMSEAIPKEYDEDPEVCLWVGKHETSVENLLTSLMWKTRRRTPDRAFSYTFPGGILQKTQQETCHGRTYSTGYSLFTKNFEYDSNM